MKPSHAGIMLLLKGHKPGEEPEAGDDTDEGETHGSLEDAASDILDALDSKDAAGLSKALGDFIDLHSSGGTGEEPSEGE